MWVFADPWIPERQPCWKLRAYFGPKTVPYGPKTLFFLVVKVMELTLAWMLSVLDMTKLLTQSEMSGTVTVVTHLAPAVFPRVGPKRLSLVDMFSQLTLIELRNGV